MSQLAALLVFGTYVLWRARIVHRTDAILSRVLIGAALVRIVLGIANHYLGPLPGARVDAVAFEETARTLALVPSGPLHFVHELGRSGYSSILAVVYMIAGHHFLFPTAINLIFVVESLILIHRIGTDLGGKEVGRLASIGAAFYPTAMLYSAVPLREAPLVWALALFAKTLVDAIDGERSLLDWRLSVSFAAMVWLHDGFAVAILLVPIAWWFRNSEMSVKRKAVLVAAGVASLLVLLTLALLYFDFNKMPTDPALLLDPEWLAEMRRIKTRSGEGYGVFAPTWGAIIGNIPLLIFAFVAGPFPAWAHGLGDLPKVAEGLLSLLLSVGACFGVVAARGTAGHRQRAFLLTLFAVMVFVFAMGTADTGIAARHRAKFLWIPILLNCAAYIDGRRRADGGSTRARSPIN